MKKVKQWPNLEKARRLANTPAAIAKRIATRAANAVKKAPSRKRAAPQQVSAAMQRRHAQQAAAAAQREFATAPLPAAPPAAPVKSVVIGTSEYNISLQPDRIVIVWKP